MLGLGFAAFDEDGRERGVFEVHLDALEGASGAAETMRWWRANPEAWAHIRRDPVPPAEGMGRCLSWLESLGSDLALAAHPLLFDGVWLDWYLRRFCDLKYPHEFRWEIAEIQSVRGSTCMLSSDLMVVARPSSGSERTACTR